MSLDTRQQTILDFLTKGPLQMLAAMLLSQHPVLLSGPAIHSILMGHDVMGIPKSHELRFDVMRHIQDLCWGKSSFING